MEDQQSEPEDVKSCCTKFYETDLVSKFLGDSFHPGGVELTVHLGERLGLKEDMKVLDVACGSGTSAITLAQKFGCHVTGIDLSEKNLAKAREKAKEAGLEDSLEFVKSDAERIQFPDKLFDAVICECALCTFPDKKTAVSEIFRVLKKGGKAGITDVVIEGELPEDLKNIFFQVACIAGAESDKGYRKLLSEGGFTQIEIEDHSHTVQGLMETAEKLMRSWDLIDMLCGCDIESVFGISKERARDLIDSGLAELEKGSIGYGLFIGVK